jgi:uncharacterized protein (DUF2267 family)
MKPLGVFNKTLARTAEYVEGVARCMGSTDMERSFQILRAVLHALRDRLPPEEAVHLGANLPMLLRGLYYEGWHIGSKPERYRHREQFLARVAKDLPGFDHAQLSRAAIAVFSMLDQHIGGEIVPRIRHCLPAELRDMWPTPAVA